MSQRRDIWTPILITVVTGLIWFWAAGETRVSQAMRVNLKFAVASQGQWGVQPPQMPNVTVTAEGSQTSIRKAEGLLKELTLDLPPVREQTTVDLTERLRSHPEVLAAGISVVASDPPGAVVMVDEIVTVQATVKLMLPDVQTIDETVEPSQVTVSMPSRLHREYPDPTVTVNTDRFELEEEGHRREGVPLDSSVGLLSREGVTVTPTEVDVTFTITSQITEHALDTPVRIQIAGPPEDTEYRIELEPKQLRGVTVQARDDLIDKIKSGEAIVVAMLHLKSTEKELGIDSKPVTYFVALLPDGTATLVNARVGNETEPPVIKLTIEERARREA